MTKYLLCPLFVFSAIAVLAQTPPTVSGINCKKGSETSLSPGEKLCFSICTSDEDANDVVTLSAEFTMPDASFDVLNKGAELEMGRFCWTPPRDAYEGSPYYVTFTATDKDGLEGSNTVKINLYEIPEISYSFEETGCGEGKLTVKEESSGIIKQIFINGKPHVFDNSTENIYTITGLQRGENELAIQTLALGNYNPYYEAKVNIEGGTVFKSESIEAFACPKGEHVVSLSTVVGYGSTFVWEDENILLKRNFDASTNRTIKVYGESGTCRDTLDVELKIAEVEADFQIETGVGTVPFTVFFESTSGKDADKFFWDFGDGNISLDENPEHTYMEAGNYTVSLVSRKQWLFGCNDTLVKTDIINAFPTGIDLPIHKDSLRAYPNPARDVLYVEAKNDMTRVSIANMKGKLLAINYELVGSQLVFDLTQLDLGTYVVLLETEHGMYQEQFVVGP